MRYQTVRRPLVIGMAVIFHSLLVFHLLFSPVIIVIAAHHGIVNASFLAFTLIFISALFLGRAYCAWFCPGCGVQEVVSLVVRRNAKLTAAVRLKYVIFSIWIGAIVLGYFRHGLQTLDVTYGMAGFTLTRKLILTFGAGLIIVPLSLIFGRFASCKYVCWQAPFLILGTKLRDRLRLPGLRLAADSGKCRGCKLCTARCPMAIDVMANVKKQDMRHAECILCGNCIDACPQQAIAFRTGRPRP